MTASITMEYRLFVPGDAAPQGSKSFKGIRKGRAVLVESSKALGPWRERVALAAHTAGVRPLVGAVTVELEFVRPRPASTPKSRTPDAVKKPDLDKLVRAIFDALEGVAYSGDAQVTDLHASKRIAEIAEAPGVRITITGQRPQEDS